MKNITFSFTIIILQLFGTTVSAQFKPGEIGYFPAQQEPYAKMHVVTQTEYTSENPEWSFPFALHTFNEQGWLMHTLYLQDSSLAPEERSPDMKDTYYYHSDG